MRKRKMGWQNMLLGNSFIALEKLQAKIEADGLKSIIYMETSTRII